MTDEPDQKLSTRPDCTPREQRWEISGGYLLHEPFQNFWPHVVLDVACWMACWPLLFTGLLISVKTLVQGVAISIQSEEVLGFLFVVTIAWFVLGFLTLVIGTIVALLSNALLTTLMIYEENLLVACLTGGLTGLLMSLAGGPWGGSEITVEGLIALIAATLLGQLGGTRGARKAEQYLPLVGKSWQKVDQPFQFNLRQLLTATIWLAVLFTGLRLAGMLTLSWATFLGTWFFMQLVAAAMIVGNWKLLERRHVPRETIS